MSQYFEESWESPRGLQTTLRTADGHYRKYFYQPILQARKMRHGEVWSGTWRKQA